MVEEKANKLIANTLKPEHVQPPPPDDVAFNYIVDIYAKWYRHYFYFCAKYACPHPDAVSPSFEAKFARMEYVGGERFHLSFMRYTGQWVQLYVTQMLDECLAAIRDEPFFQP